MKIVNDIVCCGIEIFFIKKKLRIGFFKEKCPTFFYIKEAKCYNTFIFRIFKLGFCIKTL